MTTITNSEKDKTGLNANSIKETEEISINNDQVRKEAVVDSRLAKNNWKKLIWHAKKEWHKLTEAELLKTAGDEEKLTFLLQNRYSLKRDEANYQVKFFYSKHTMQ